MSDDAVQLLLVDDDPLTLKSLRLLFSKSGYDVMTASDGRLAQTVLENEGYGTFDCVLTDFRMPEMTGLELISWMAQKDPTLSSILITAEGDKNLVASALRGGVSDFIEKPYRFGMVREAVERAVERTRHNRALASTASEVREITQLHERLNFMHENEAMPVPGDTLVGVITRMHPIRETGGDFINSYPMRDGRICLIMGDVSGHDLKAGFISAYFQGMVRGMFDADVDISRISSNFNAHLIQDWNRPLSKGERAPLKTSLASCILVMDFEQWTYEMDNHGLPKPLLYDGGIGLDFLGSGSPPLGWFSNIAETTVSQELPKSGRFYMWSDGLEDFAATLNISPVTLAWRLSSEGNAIKREEILHDRKDDVLVACIHWGLDADEVPEPFFYACYKGGTEHAVDDYERIWLASLTWAFPDMDGTRRSEISLSVREGVINALLHGTRGRAERSAYLRMFYRPDRDLIIVSIEDEGEGYDFSSNKISNEPDSSGHISFGLRIIASYVRNLEYLDGGRILKLEFSLSE